MIDPINNQAYQRYTTVTEKKITNAGDQPSFSLENNDDGVVYEPGDKKEDQKVAPKRNDADRQNAYSKSQSDSLELSSVDTPAEGATPSHKTGSLLDTLRNFFEIVRVSLKKVWSVVWEDSGKASEPAVPTEDAAVPTEEIESAVTDTVLPISDAEQLSDNLRTSDSAPGNVTPENDPAIRKALKEKDAATFHALLSEDGQRIPAKNTDLLTYYDRSGNLVNVDPSYRQRILHGDHGSQKS